MRRLALLPRVALGGCLPLALAGCTTAPTPGPSEPAPSATAETPSAPPPAEPTPTDSPSPIPDTHELDVTAHETFDEPSGSSRLIVLGDWFHGQSHLRIDHAGPRFIVEPRAARPGATLSRRP